MSHDATAPVARERTLDENGEVELRHEDQVSFVQDEEIEHARLDQTCETAKLLRIGRGRNVESFWEHAVRNALRRTPTIVILGQDPLVAGYSGA